MNDYVQNILYAYINLQRIKILYFTKEKRAPVDIAEHCWN